MSDERLSEKKKHIATIALYGITGRRVGTGYCYSWEDIDRRRAEHERFGVPFQLRWRNDEVRRKAYEERGLPIWF